MNDLSSEIQRFAETAIVDFGVGVIVGYYTVLPIRHIIPLDPHPEKQ